MKPEFSYRSPRAIQRRAPFFGAFLGFVAICVLFFAIDISTSGTVRREVRRAGGAALSVTASVGSSVSESGFFSSRRTLQQENDALRRELSLVSEKMASYHLLEEENTELRMFLDIVEEGGVAARVVSSFNAIPYGTFVVYGSGLQNGALVLTDGGFVLGEIVSVSGASATVHSIFAPDSTVDLVAGEVAFSADGRGGGNARAEVPREAELAIGDVVRAPQFGARPAGIIGHIESASSSATQTLFVRAPVNLQTLHFVYVVPR
ncbi:MAG: rod shape-determining protein MreC [Minisyncoccia bacterium]